VLLPQADRRAPRRAAVSGFRATFVAYVCADYGLDCGVSAWFVALRGAVFDWPDPCASAFLMVLFFSSLLVRGSELVCFACLGVGCLSAVFGHCIWAVRVSQFLCCYPLVSCGGLGSLQLCFTTLEANAVNLLDYAPFGENTVIQTCSSIFLLQK